MFRRIASACIAIAALVCVVAARQPESRVFDQIDSIVKSLSDITDLPEKHTVPYSRISKRDLRRFLTKRIKKTLKPQEIYADELALKMFGLVPQTFDLRKSTIDLLTEQAAAFYDYDKKKLFLLEGTSFEAETTTLAHELSHALADQHFDLGKFMQDAPANDDENLAHTAVVEGQASWLMLAYDLKQAGQPPVPTAEMLSSVADSSEESMTEYPVLKNSPLYIQQSLLFPYTQGILFFDAVYKRLGKGAFAAVFKDPPSDSAEVIHPERYFAHNRASKPALPTFTLKEHLHELTEGSVGEFDHEMLLQQYINEAKSAGLARHVRGGQFKIAEAGKNETPLLEYVSEWESEDHARTFFECYQQILAKKWKRCDVLTRGNTVFAGEGDTGYFFVQLKGAIVMSIEGLSDREDWERLRPVPERVSAALHCCVEFHP